MISNFHTHTTFCDGKSTPENVILSAIEKGFFAIGFSAHGYTDYDLRYCMKDSESYIKEITQLKEKYKNKIQIYLGIEEDAFAPIDRSRFDYIIGSSHYFRINDRHYPIDSNYEYFKKCLEAFDYDIIRMAEVYYEKFCEYINTRRPDIIGHFDLITKFDELDTPLFLNNAKYNKLAKKYVTEAAKSGCVFEVNTGAIARNLRTSPYPSSDLLYVLKELDASLILSADSHSADTLDFGFDEAKRLLLDIGFTKLVTIDNGKLIKYDIKI